MAGRLDRQLRWKVRQAERRALGNPDLSDGDRQAKFGLVGAALEATQEEQTLGNYKGKVVVSQLGKSCSPWESEGSPHATHKACRFLTIQDWRSLEKASWALFVLSHELDKFNEH